MRNNLSPDRLASSPPTPRQRGASVGSSSSSSSIENLSSSRFNQFSRHTKARLSATEPPALSSMSMTTSMSSSSFERESATQQQSVERVDVFHVTTRRSSDPLANDDYYAAQRKLGNFIRMGWLTKQGHMWYVSSVVVCVCGDR